LIINQVLYFRDQLDNFLLNPNQLRAHGITVDDVPKCLSKGKSTHSIIIHGENINIPLNLNDIISYFPIRTPTQRELEELNLITLTSDIEWNPHSSTFQELEESFSKNNERTFNIKKVHSQPYCQEIIDDISRKIETVQQQNVSSTEEERFC